MEEGWKKIYWSRKEGMTMEAGGEMGKKEEFE